MVRADQFSWNFGPPDQNFRRTKISVTVLHGICLIPDFSSFFFTFLGPVVNHLQYWGEQKGHRRRHRVRKLDPENQLFLTLIKLRLNLAHTIDVRNKGIGNAHCSRDFPRCQCTRVGKTLMLIRVSPRKMADQYSC